MLESGPLRMKEGVLQVIEGGWDEYATIVFGVFLQQELSGFKLTVRSRSASRHWIFVYEHEQICSRVD